MSFFIRDPRLVLSYIILLIIFALIFILNSCASSGFIKDNGMTPTKATNTKDTWDLDYPASSVAKYEIKIIWNERRLERRWDCTKPPHQTGIQDGDFIAFVIAELKRSGLWEKVINIRWEYSLHYDGTFINNAVIYLPKEEK